MGRPGVWWAVTVIPATPDDLPADVDVGDVPMPSTPALPFLRIRPVDAVAPAFDDFYRDQYRSVFALALALTGSPTTAEDLVQEGFTAAYRRWARIAEYDRPGAWLRRVVLHRATSLRRKARTGAAAVVRLGRGPEPTALAPRDADLWARVRALPARQAQVVALVYVDQLTVAEAAGVLGCSISSAKTHLARARQRLQRDLADWKDAR
jgi:RNA polymerase sigma factor (sigma-70 family)